MAGGTHHHKDVEEVMEAKAFQHSGLFQRVHDSARGVGDPTGEHPNQGGNRKGRDQRFNNKYSIPSQSQVQEGRQPAKPADQKYF